MFKIHRLPSWAKFCYETCSCIEENDPNIAISKKRALIAVSQAEKGKRSTSLMICRLRLCPMQIAVGKGNVFSLALVCWPRRDKLDRLSRVKTSSLSSS
ncbi:hypothetical protein M514_04093 [Trichuris suis]|uniref:Uncharacterized protein n=1 Tax=Trichuris suis TaxID=68888 RepID=A0A085NFZ4_9BILA|nr:hypothetical protein M514_04093 [Trichuris suis]